jgi:hypothetical protein
MPKLSAAGGAVKPEWREFAPLSSYAPPERPFSRLTKARSGLLSLKMAIAQQLGSSHDGLDDE